ATQKNNLRNSKAHGTNSSKLRPHPGETNDEENNLHRFTTPQRKRKKAKPGCLSVSPSPSLWYWPDSIFCPIAREVPFLQQQQQIRIKTLSLGKPHWPVAMPRPTSTTLNNIPTGSSHRRLPIH